MAGAVAGLFSGAVSNIFGGSLMGSLLQQFGLDDVMGSIQNLFMETLGTALKQVLDMSPLPDFLKDAAKSFIDEVTGGREDVSPEAQQAVNDSPLGEVVEEMVKEIARDAANEADENSGSGRGEGGGSWLHVLAEAIGKAQSNLGDRLMEKAEALQEQYDTEDKDAFFSAQADFTATGQMFSMVSNQGSTALKTVGEGLAGMARKQ